MFVETLFNDSLKFWGPGNFELFVLAVAVPRSNVSHAGSARNH